MYTTRTQPPPHGWLCVTCNAIPFCYLYHFIDHLAFTFTFKWRSFIKLFAIHWKSIYFGIYFVSVKFHYIRYRSSIIQLKAKEKRARERKKEREQKKFHIITFSPILIWVNYKYMHIVVISSDVLFHNLQLKRKVFSSRCVYVFVASHKSAMHCNIFYAHNMGFVGLFPCMICS